VAVVVIGAVFFLAGVGFFLVTLKQRGEVRRVSGVPAASQIHAELALTPSIADQDELAPEPALVTAAAAAPTRAPVRESYYAVAPPSRAKGRPTGWYSVNGNLSDERFWDGRTWTARRQMVSGVWSSVPVAD
jgi:hypothetical protein